MAKKRTKKRTPQKRVRGRAQSPEGIVESIVARPLPTDETASERAADHHDAALKALDNGDWDAAVRHARSAVEAYPRHIASLQLNAELASTNDAQLLAALRVVLRVAREELGEQAFDDDRGHFWGLVETRPYMQLKMRIVEMLRTLGDTQTALAECEELLALNPHDNQGARYPLLGLYLAAGRLDAADALIQRYDEDSAVMRWGRLLWHLKRGETGEDAASALAAATACNQFVAPLLLAVFEMPARLPTAYSPGGPSEAVIAADCLLDGWWHGDDAPLRWLAERVTM